MWSARAQARLPGCRHLPESLAKAAYRRRGSMIGRARSPGALSCLFDSRIIPSVDGSRAGCDDSFCKCKASPYSDFGGKISAPHFF